jgi:lactoylglutathione lyase
MKINHIALWTKDIEKLRSFYMKYFGAASTAKYVNRSKEFESYFLSFSEGTRLEIMAMPNIPENLNNSFDQYTGLIHLSISVGSKEKVISLTNELRSNGFIVISEPRHTGDGYFESCVFDPDGNRIEITI